MQFHPFELSGTENVSSQCQRDLNEFVTDLEAFELWALQSECLRFLLLKNQNLIVKKNISSLSTVYDSGAKLPSGILNGNLNQLGDFDTCLKSVSNSELFTGKYCLSRVMVSVPNNFHYMRYLRKLVMSLEPYRSKFKDVSFFFIFSKSFIILKLLNAQPNHVIPKTSEIHWALCVPSSCSYQDIETSLQQKLKKIFNESSIEITVEVRENMCQVADKNWTSKIEIGSYISMQVIEVFFIIS